jgi:hypothetical protein
MTDISTYSSNVPIWFSGAFTKFSIHVLCRHTIEVSSQEVRAIIAHRRIPALKRGKSQKGTLLPKLLNNRNTRVP